MIKLRQQQGVALITVLLVVVIATVLGVAMVRDQQSTIQRSRHNFDHNQAIQYALGGEELARQVLWQSHQDDASMDNLQQAWAKQMQFEFEDGQVQLMVEDMQGRINLNNLAANGSDAELTRARLNGLFVQLGIDPVFIDRIADWIDSDADVRPLGAEDFAYLGLDRPYRTSGQLMIDLSELRLLLDMTPEVYQQLRRYTTVLPESTLALNINTAPAEVLQSLSPKLSLESAQQLVASRESSEGFASVTAFLQSPELAGLGIAEQGLSVQSSYFESRVIAHYLERAAYLTSTIERIAADGSTRVIYRNSSKKILPMTDSQAESDTVEQDEGETGV